MKFEFDTYNQLITNSFSFLVEANGFGNPIFYKNQYCSYAEFTKGILMVQIVYSFKNKTIMCNIFNHIDKVKPGEYSWKYSVDVDHLLMRNEKELYSYKKYLEYMPDKIGFEASIKKVAELLKEYGHKILKGGEWVSWGEIADYKREVPDYLP